MSYAAANGAIEVNLVTLTVSSSLDIVYCFLSIYLINRVRLNPSATIKGLKKGSHLGVWGYVWRGFSIVTGSKIIAFILISIAPINIEMPSTVASIIVGAMQFCIMLALIWFFYLGKKTINE